MGNGITTQDFCFSASRHRGATTAEHQRLGIRAALWSCLLSLLAATQRCLFQTLQRNNIADERTRLILP